MEEIEQLSIAILEDNDADHLVLQKMLTENGFHLDRIHRVRALADFEYRQESFVLCDLNLEDSKGIETLRAVIDQVPAQGTSVIAFTGEDD